MLNAKQLAILFFAMGVVSLIFASYTNIIMWILLIHAAAIEFCIAGALLTVRQLYKFITGLK